VQLVLFCDLLQFDWLPKRAVFTIFSPRAGELCFSNKPRSEDKFQTQNTSHKVKKLSYRALKKVKYSELTSMDLLQNTAQCFICPTYNQLSIHLWVIILTKMFYWFPWIYRHIFMTRLFLLVKVRIWIIIPKKWIYNCITVRHVTKPPVTTHSVYTR
jgi:hypothetical protein